MSDAPRETETGHRSTPAGGPKLRADVVDVYVFRRAGPKVEFLQLLRASDPLARTWHPIMGHIEAGESAVAAALREMREEVGLDPGSPACLGVWALEQVRPFYIAAIDTIVMSPRFACEVSPAWMPALNDEHAEWRWVDQPGAFMWPGQRGCIEEILGFIIAPESLARERLSVPVR